MEIIWHVEDGYVGCSRPHKIKFKIESWDDYEINAGEIWDEVVGLVENEFKEKISWFIDNEGEIRKTIDEFIKNHKVA